MRAQLHLRSHSPVTLIAVLACFVLGQHALGQQATGPAAEVLALERKIEAAVVKGDTAFAETALSSDFHFRHGDGWTRGEKTGGMEDDRAALMKRIADKEYLVHDLDGTRIEMHG